jgi:hypothetical protein
MAVQIAGLGLDSRDKVYAPDADASDRKSETPELVPWSWNTAKAEGWLDTDFHQYLKTHLTFKPA